ncbi:hypothetical protein K6119_15975 [Paracrocinitomix mangrovi]|uniref:hypothetical protein n=1 Tax=Paracrocinitomix mangrovi TaxID=2862509 RepID=UPI001C8E406A|nr:hypothetical protein [Paracrocinitomix mangrovi]UKN01227.1 hypothetical protein K6119_15975 [Paracrocinitomix mangrovi]
MAKSRLVLRWIVSAILLVVFVSIAYLLYHKQQLKLNFQSFELENAEASVIVPDVNRLVDKIESVNDLGIQNWPNDLASALNEGITHKDFSYNRELSQGLYLSISQDDFVVVLNTTASVNSILDVVQNEFEVKVTEDDGKATINGVELNYEHFGNYLAFSNTSISPKQLVNKPYFGNADYVVFDKENVGGVKHILSRKYHYSMWEEKKGYIKGRPVSHHSFFSEVPTVFDSLIFYGSTRFDEDVNTYFNSPADQSFAWLSEGLLIIKSGENEILIGKQGDARDLKLMLEEQTLDSKEDSASLNYFNIGNFKILPFVSVFNWTEAIPELRNEMKFYTEHKNFNVMANSIPAMRWYLGQIQLGNLLGENEQLFGVYDDCLPELAHYINMTKQDNGGYNCSSNIYQLDSSCIVSYVAANEQKVQMEGVEIVHNFAVDIVPDNIQVFQQNKKSYVLLNNSNKVQLYAVDGEREWALQLSTPLIEKPQIVDFENDGFKEYVFFQSNQIDIVKSDGKSLNGFPIMLNGNSKAGLAVNYDNKFNWRLLVNVDNTVKVYSEEGKLVEGWVFNGMQSGIKGKIYHVITKGKDIITFKDDGNKQHVLNRRGEYRFDKEVNFKLPNETDFVVGSLESALRKMGYKDGYIYNYYILDGTKDSVIVDQKVTPIKTYWEYNQGNPLLIIEEPGRLLIVNQFGYVMSEVLKPNQTNDFVGLVGEKDFGFMFSDNSQNSIYLLNNYGKMILPNAIEGSYVSVINGNLLYTFSGSSVKAYKIAE